MQYINWVPRLIISGSSGNRLFPSETWEDKKEKQSTAVSWLLKILKWKQSEIKKKVHD